MSRLLFLVFGIIAYGHPCFADADWTRLVVRVSTNEQAKATSLLKEELYDLQYDAQLKLSDVLIKNPESESAIMESLENPKIEQHYLTDGTIEYDYQIPLTGSIIRETMPAARPVQLMVPMLCPTCGQPWPHDKSLPEGLTLIPKDNEFSDFTGIIIDCRGFVLRPCMFPKILNEKLGEVYSSNFTDPQFLVLRGLVAYYDDEAQAELRIGKNPMIIKATGVTGKVPTDIKISSRDAQGIHSSQNNLNLLRECRVAIIFGQ